jgi:large subunit ribosomal protein L30e
MDFNTSLRRAIRTGNVILGQHKTEHTINAGEAKLVVVASNCPAVFRERVVAKENLTVHVFEGSGVQLGKACGKPFMVSVLAVIDPGESDILNISRK